MVRVKRKTSTCLCVAALVRLCVKHLALYFAIRHIYNRLFLMENVRRVYVLNIIFSYDYFLLSDLSSKINLIVNNDLVSSVCRKYMWACVSTQDVQTWSPLRICRGEGD